MAKEIIERLLDDFDGTPDAHTVHFALDGQAWTIDLNAKHDSELRARLGPFIDAARRVRSEARGTQPSGRPVGDRERNAGIRSWALSEGVELPSRGRIASAVQDAYDAKDGDVLRAAFGLELVANGKGRRRRRATTTNGAEAQ